MTKDIDATEAAQEFAAENGIDLAQVEGTGKDGRVGLPDVQKFLDDATNADGDAQEGAQGESDAEGGEDAPDDDQGDSDADAGEGDDVELEVKPENTAVAKDVKPDTQDNAPADADAQTTKADDAGEQSVVKKGTVLLNFKEDGDKYAIGDEYKGKQAKAHRKAGLIK